MPDFITHNIWFVAAVWMGLALIASIISIRLGIAVALIEILIGIIAGNFLGIHATTDWINFLAMLGSGVITFLAGAEIDPASLKAHIKPAFTIGVLSFLLPFLFVWIFAQFVMGWSLHQAQIAGIALSTTSVAVVYAVMIEGGRSNTDLGKMILAACFITDFGTVLALGGLFADFNWYMLVFIAVLPFVLWYMPRWTQFIIRRMGATQVSEPEVKFIFLFYFFLAGFLPRQKVKRYYQHI
jgi:Kef-type K+ transport system membrane component KefB